MKEGVIDSIKVYFNRDKLTQELKTTSRWLLTLTSEWWSWGESNYINYTNKNRYLIIGNIYIAPIFAPILLGNKDKSHLNHSISFLNLFLTSK